MRVEHKGTKFRYARRAFYVLVTLVLALGYATAAHAAPGDPDPGFDGDGKAATDFPEAMNDSGLDVAVQEDGKILVSGSVTGSQTGNDFAVARYNPDGSPDATFGTGGMVVTPVGPGASNDEAYAVAVRPDGKIVAGGFADNYHPGTGDRDADFVAVRYLADGSLDPTFGTAGKVITDLGSASDYAVDVAVRGTKTILAGRSASASQEDFTMVRYDDAGNLDAGFGTNGVARTDFFGSADFGEDIAIGPDGTILLAGFTRDPSNTAAGQDFALARYGANGNLDTDFGTGGKVATHFGSGEDRAHGVVVQEDGGIVVGGRARNGSRDDFALARYRADGSLDDEFDFDGRVLTDFGGAGGVIWDLALQDDGRIVAAGTAIGGSTGSSFGLVRYNTDGSLNGAFSNDGRVVTDFFGRGDEARGVALQEDGGIVAAGLADTTFLTSDRKFVVARYFGGNDATAPRVNAPTQGFLAGSALGTTNVPVRISWSAADAEGAVTGYGLQRSVDGGDYRDVRLRTPSTKTVTQALLPGHSYRYRVRATDDNGNRSVWKYGTRFAVEAHQETGAGITYAGTWKSQSVASAYGGTLRYASSAGSTAELAFTGRDVAWVAPKGPTRGKAEVYLDDRKVAKVDLFSATAQARRVVFTTKGLDPSTGHTLRIETLGTAGRPRVDVDAFVVLR